MRKTLEIVGVAAVALLLTALLATRSQLVDAEQLLARSSEPYAASLDPKTPAPQSDTARPARTSRSNSLASWAWGSLSWLIYPTYSQRFSVQNFREVVVREESTDSITGAKAAIEHLGSSSFNIRATASARRDVFAFGGYARNNDFVLEVWELKPPESSASVLGAGGLAQPDSSVNLIPKRFYKTEIFRGPLADFVLGMDMDSEGRFIIALMGAGNDRFLYRFDTGGLQPPQLLFDVSTLPELASMVRIQKFQHAVLGRTWSLTDDDLPYSVQILLTDSDNDGVFDGSPIVGDQALFQAAGIDAYEHWDSLDEPPVQ